MSTYVKDLAERVALVFAASFLAVFTVGDLNSAKAAAVAGAAAVVGLLKGLVAKKVGNGDSASFVV
jgi:hypothetical protein